MLCRRYRVSTGVALIVIIAAVTLGLLAIVIAVLGATFHHREVSLVRVWTTSGHVPFTTRQATKYAIPGHPMKLRGGMAAPSRRSTTNYSPCLTWNSMLTRFHVIHVKTGSMLSPC